MDFASIFHSLDLHVTGKGKHHFHRVLMAKSVPSSSFTTTHSNPRVAATTSPKAAPRTTSDASSPDAKGSASSSACSVGMSSGYVLAGIRSRIVQAGQRAIGVRCQTLRLHRESADELPSIQSSMGRDTTQRSLVVNHPFGSTQLVSSGAS